MRGRQRFEENRRNMPDEQLAELPPGEAFIKNYIRNSPRGWYDPHFDSTPLWEGVDVNMDMFDYVWGELFRDIDVTRGLETFDRPVFLALGRHDFLGATPSAWDPITDRFADVTVRIFEESGHTPQFDEPELFDTELLAWIEEHEVRSGTEPHDRRRTPTAASLRAAPRLPPPRLFLASAEPRLAACRTFGTGIGRQACQKQGHERTIPSGRSRHAVLVAAVGPGLASGRAPGAVRCRGGVEAGPA